MKKFFIVMLFVLIAVSFTAAKVVGNQNLGGGLQLGLPVDDYFNDAAGTGVGITLQYNRVMTPEIVLTASTGYILWGGEDYGGASWSWSEIPIRGGVKYFFSPSFYGIGELALHMYMFSVEYDQSYWGLTDYSDSESEFGVSIGVGYEHPINDKMSLDASASYEINDLDYIGVRIALLWGLGK